MFKNCLGSDMVVGDKNMEEARNGKRSRGPSPNGHLSDDSSATDDSDHDNCMRIGDEYQTAIPSYNPDAKPESRMEAMLVWAPHPDLPECKVDEYISIAKEKHGYNTEQALGMLFWHKHNVDKALSDLANFTPFPDEWTVEDKVLFEQAFSFHGKSFHRIRQMLPDKSIASLVKYYYSWKKTRSRTSLMDRQARKLASQREDSEEEREGSGNSDSDFEHSQENGKETENKNSTTRPGPKSSQLQGKHNLKNKRRPPKGMHLNYEDLLAIATGPPGQGDAILRALDEELVTLKRQVQNNKQIISMQKHKTSQGIETCRVPETAQRINARWTHDELLLAVQGVRKYGKEFKAIAETIGNKTDAHIRSFFANYRRRYNLDEVLAEYEKENGTIEIKEDDEEPMEIDITVEPPINDATPSTSQEEQKPVVSAPPPLLKQPPNNKPSISIRQPPLQQHQGRVAPGPRLLQQPPPLVRPVVPVMGHITGHKPQPPQLTSRD